MRLSRFRTNQYPSSFTNIRHISKIFSELCCRFDGVHWTKDVWKKCQFSIQLLYLKNAYQFLSLPQSLTSKLPKLNFSFLFIYYTVLMFRKHIFRLLCLVCITTECSQLFLKPLCSGHIKWMLMQNNTKQPKLKLLAKFTEMTQNDKAIKLQVKLPC